MSEINIFGKKVKKKTFWIVVGLGVPGLCILAFVAFFIFQVTLGGSNYATDSVTSSGYDGEFFYDTDEDYTYPEEAEMDRGDYTESSNAPLATQMPSDGTIAGNGVTAVTERLIIREGNITIAVEQTRATRDAIEDIVFGLQEQGAYVVTSSENGRGEGLEPYINLTIRVPVTEFADIMDQIAEMGIEVGERYETADDVTEEYVDLTGRIEALEVARDRLLGIMQDAEFTEDLLLAEQQLTQREAELEALQGRLNYLAESASLSRININITPYELYEPIDTSWQPAETFKRAVENLVDSLQGFADFMIVFSIAVLPWLVILGLIVWIVVAVVRRRRSKKQAKQAQE